MLVESHEEWEVEEILCARHKAKRKGKGREVLVKWAGHYEPTWEPLDIIADTAAMEHFKGKYGDAEVYDRPRKT